MKTRLSIVCTALVLFVASCTETGKDNPTYGDNTINDNSSSELVADNLSKDLNFAGVKSPLKFGKAYTCQNLQVFMIEGKTDLESKKFVPLNEAMAQKMVKIHETSEVNELSIDNNSDEYVFINAGDVVKGGKQDRTIQYDIVLAPGEKNVDLASFCVESGRWTNRGEEEVEEFASNTTMLPSRKMKVAAKYKGSQQDVWDGVAEHTSKLNVTLNAAAPANAKPIEVKSEKSPTSLQLALENKELNITEKKIRDCLGDVMEQNPNAIGFAYAINGELYGIDIYNNKGLFEGLWDKLLSAAIVESIGEVGSVEEFDNITAEQIVQATHKVQLQRRPDVQEPNKGTKMHNRHSKKGDVLHSATFDNESKGAWLHQNYLTNDLKSESKSKQSQVLNGNLNQTTTIPR